MDNFILDNYNENFKNFPTTLSLRIDRWNKYSKITCITRGRQIFIVSSEVHDPINSSNYEDCFNEVQLKQIETLYIIVSKLTFPSMLCNVPDFSYNYI